MAQKGTGLTGSPSAKADPRLVGTLYGIAAALIWGSYFGLARSGTVAGLAPLDFVMLRIIPGACLALPIVFIRGFRDLAGVGWLRALVLSLCIGPLFVLLASGGFQFAPLAHAAVLQPGTMTLSSVVIAAFVFADKITPQRLGGALAIILGLILVAGSSFSDTGAQSYIGDMMFASAGFLWAIYTALVRRWQIEAISGTAATLVVSGAVALLLGGLSGTFHHLASFPPSMIALQALMQGVLAGFLGVVFYGRSVTLLGAGRATLFAAIVPVVATLMGIPLAGEWPTPVQWAGVGVVTLGLLLSLGVAVPRLSTR